MSASYDTAQIQVINALAGAKRVSFKRLETFNQDSRDFEVHFMPRLAGHNCTDNTGRYKFPSPAEAKAAAAGIRDRARAIVASGYQR